ncbi:MAG: hypothetical protein ACQETI_03940 [Halobacteriota archaeon]
MRNKTLVLVLVFSLFVPAVITGISTGAEPTTCNPKSGVDFCVLNVDSSKNQVEQGETAILTVTIRNVGNETGDVLILLGIEQPEGGYTYWKAADVHDVPPGTSKEIDLPTRMRENGEPGPHYYNIMLLDPPQQHLYDATGYYQTIIATNDSLDVFKWVAGLNNFARALIAIGVIVGALLGKKFL